MGCAKGDEGNATAKGGAVPSIGRCDPAAGCKRPTDIQSRGLGAHRCPIPAARGPSGDAFGRHCVTLLGIVEQATTCVVRLVIIPILPATRSAEDLFRGFLASVFSL